MRILGIYYGHNATATLLEDGKIISSVSEERFTGIKNQRGIPKQAIEFILKSRNLSIAEDIDKIVFPVQKNAPILTSNETKDNNIFILIINYLYKHVPYIRNSYGFVSFSNPSLKPVGRFFYNFFSKTIGKYTSFLERRMLSRYFNIDSSKISSYDHHTCHAFSTYYASPYNNEKALVLTLDAEGDGECATVNVFNGNDHIRFATTHADNSIGWFYMGVTEYLGMTIMEHEYKVMGLAPYAKNHSVNKVYPRLKDLFYLGGKDNLEIRCRIDPRHTVQYLRDNYSDVRFDVLAGVTQRIVEEIVVAWVRQSIKITGVNTICVAGGVFMNVKLNQKIWEMPEVKQIFYLPSCGDESSPIGACYISYLENHAKLNKKKMITPIQDIYWGPEFSNNDVKIFIEKQNLSKKYEIRYYKEIETEIAKLLARKKIVGRMAGKMEWGARALGNRSILANPSDSEAVMILNEQMKDRDFWMPFTPSIIEEKANDYIHNPKNMYSPYMIVTFDSTKLAHGKLKSAIHPYDLTVRPQMVRKEWNQKYHKLISAFGKTTGIYAVLNTSFNLHGLPIVLGPKEALYAFENSGLRYLALENYLISKRNV